MPLSFYITRLFSNLVSRLPFRLIYFLSDLIFPVVYHLIKYRRTVVRENLKFAFPDKSNQERITIEKAFYHHFCDLNLEILKIETMHTGALNERVKFINLEILDEYIKNKRSLIAVTSHNGNWEWGGLALSDKLREFKVLGVYKPLANQYFDAYFRKLRSRLGMELVPMKTTLRAILRNRKLLTITTLLSDQSPTAGETEYVTSFMGRKVPVFLGAEKLARLTKYPVIYLAMRKLKRGYYEVEIIPVAEIPESQPICEITEKHLRILENELNKQPETWLWSHRRWKHAGKSWPASVEAS